MSTPASRMPHERLRLPDASALARAPFPLLVLAPALVACLLLTACGSGGSTGNGAGTLKDLHNPAVAATATPPQRLATPLAAVAVSQSGGAALGAQPNTVVVKPGDTLAAIAQANGVSLADLERANGLNDSSVLHIGDTLTIPRPGASPTPAAGGGPALSTPGPLGTASIGSSIPPTGGAPSGGGGIGTPGPGGTVAPAASASAAAGATQQYTVASGDTACKIAVAHNISVAELAAANGMTTTQIARLQVGQLLKIPPATGHRDC